MSAGFLQIAALAAFVALATFACFLPSLLRKRRRARLLALEPPAEWDDLLERNLTLYKGLPAELRLKLKRLAQTLLAEKRFEGCGGLALTEEMKLIIAAEACVLLLGREHPSFFHSLESVLVYPGSFYSQERTHFSGQTLAEDDAEKLGESWHDGVIILSWEHVKREGNMLNDGVNVVYHEFAHQLDEESGFADGAPALEGSGISYRDWSRTLMREYSSFLRGVRRGRRGPIDEYASTNPAEFFAVVTESFLERPGRLRAHYPKLYEEFKRFYGFDPSLWGLDELHP